MGTLTHMVVLEGPKKFLENYYMLAPINKSTNEEYGFTSKAFQVAQIETRAEFKKELCRLEDYKKALQMRLTVRQHPEAARLLADGVAERVVRGSYKGMAVQIKMDWLGPLGIVDLKTVADIDRFFNGSKYDDCSKYGYLHSAAFYREILHRANPDLPKQDFHFIVVEKTPPFPVCVWKISNDVLDEYAELNEQALVDLTNCIYEDTWPSPYKEMRTIDL
jgi:hypothetical protein